MSLYYHPEFLFDIANECLIGEKIEVKHLNHYWFGESMKSVTHQGPTEIFTGIVFEMINKNDTDYPSDPYDTTTITNLENIIPVELRNSTPVMTP